MGWAIVFSWLQKLRRDTGQLRSGEYGQDSNHGLSLVLEIAERVVVAGGGSAVRSRALAGVLRLEDGDLLVGYREGSDHLKTDDGVVMKTRSSDGGRSWQRPSPAWYQPGWDCAGGRSMAVTPDGELVMFVLQARRAGGAPQAHVYPTWSTDGGRTWGPLGQEITLFRGWTEPNPQGRIFELSDGRWMMPAYGSDVASGIASPTAGGAIGYTITAVSNDQGRTWRRQGVMARSDSIHFNEPAVLRLSGGRFMAVIRTQGEPFTSYLCYSGDEARTWSEPRELPFAGQTPYMIELDGGSVLCAYRDRDPLQLGISASVTRDGGMSWQYAGRLYEGTDWNCGYPGLVQLADGYFFCVYYTCYKQVNCEVHGLILRVDD